MKILESAENYLEAILMVRKQKGSVRAIDIVNFLGFSKPSVSVAMKRLLENGYIQIAPDGHISLTESGSEIATSIYERHEFMTEYLVSIGVDRETAMQDACRIEHVLSAQSFEKLKAHLANGG